MIMNDSDNLTYEDDMYEVVREHKGIVSFWLWFIILTNIAAIIFLLTCVRGYVTWFYATDESAQLFFWAQHNVIDYYDYGLMANVIAMALNVVSAILLMKWKAWGFWLYVFSNIVIIGIMAFFGHLGGVTDAVSMTILGAIASPIILYVILNLDNQEGESTSSQVD